MENRLYAVLTGDIIKSSRLPTDDLEAVRGLLRDGVEGIRKWERGLVRGKLEFFRGDSWQLLITDPGRSLRAALYLRAVLIAAKIADSRIAIGIGTVKSLNPRRISQSTGEAFTLSGQALDLLREASRLAVALSDDVPEGMRLLGMVTRLCGSLVNDWTSRQAEVAALALHPDEPIQEDIASALDPPVTRQGVSKALIAANWKVIHDALLEVESVDWNRPFSNLKRMQ